VFHSGQPCTGLALPPHRGKGPLRPGALGRLPTFLWTLTMKLIHCDKFLSSFTQECIYNASKWPKHNFWGPPEILNKFFI